MYCEALTSLKVLVNRHGVFGRSVQVPSEGSDVESDLEEVFEKREASTSGNGDEGKVGRTKVRGNVCGDQPGPRAAISSITETRTDIERQGKLVLSVAIDNRCRYHLSACAHCGSDI